MPDNSPLRIKKTVILGRNELSFREQDVPRSREQQWKTYDIDTTDSRPKKKQKKKMGSDFFQQTAGQKRRLVAPQRLDHAEAKTVRRFRNFFFLSHHRL